VTWAAYGGDDAGDGVVSLIEACEVSWHFVEQPASEDASIYVEKVDGDDPNALTINLIQPDVGEFGGSLMEIYIRFHN
jgi:hypothetical protein